MNRRTFLALAATAAATAATGVPKIPTTLAALTPIDRMSQWKPNTRRYGFAES